MPQTGIVAWRARLALFLRRQWVVCSDGEVTIIHSVLVMKILRSTRLTIGVGTIVKERGVPIPPKLDLLACRIAAHRNFLAQRGHALLGLVAASSSDNQGYRFAGLRKARPGKTRDHLWRRARRLRAG